MCHRMFLNTSRQFTPAKQLARTRTFPEADGVILIFEFHSFSSAYKCNVLILISELAL